MLFKNFNNYEEFKQLYVREDGKRKNAILLAYVTSPEVRKWYARQERLDVLYGIKDMNTLFKELLDNVRYSSYGANKIRLTKELPILRSDIYAMDEQQGVCFDGDFTAYRYRKNSRIYKMKVGRLVKNVIEESYFGKDFMPNQCKLWLCEEIGQKWQSYVQSTINGYTLVVDDDFESIYDRNLYKDCIGMGSCMENDGYHTFYNDAVDASAASLRDEEGAIVSRCVIYNNAKQVGTDKTFRLCERQYAIEGRDLYKRLLVTKLIEAGLIDAYKPAGAGCHEPCSWVDTNGNPLNEVRFAIKCELNDGDKVSYQDSFKWFSPKLQMAFNYSVAAEDACNYLETTNGHFRGRYDSWCEEYVDEDVYPVYANGRLYHTTQWIRDDDFYYVERLDQYHHCDDVTYCECCNVWVLNDDAYYSDLTGEEYCCQDCLEEAEEEYRKEHPEEE